MGVGAEAVLVTLYGEALCPYCARFTTEVVAPLLQEDAGLSGIFNFSYVAWGNAIRTKDVRPPTPPRSPCPPANPFNYACFGGPAPRRGRDAMNIRTSASGSQLSQRLAAAPARRSQLHVHCHTACAAPVCRALHVLPHSLDPMVSGANLCFADAAWYGIRRLFCIWQRLAGAYNCSMRCHSTIADIAYCLYVPAAAPMHVYHAPTQLNTLETHTFFFQIMVTFLS